MSSTSGDFDFASRPLLSKLLLDPSWNLNETPNLVRILRDKQNNVYLIPTVLASTRGVGTVKTIVTADLGTIPQGLGGMSGITPANLGTNGLTVNSLENLWNGSSLDVAMDYYASRTTSAATTAQTVTFFKANLSQHLAIHCVENSAGTATLTIKASVDNTNFLTLYSQAAATTNEFDLVGSSPLSSTNTIAATNVSNPIGFGGAVTMSINLNALAFPFLSIVAGAGSAGTTTLTIAVK
jgi:hypothetical protein